MQELRPIPALMLGGPGRLPFTGHFRGAVVSQRGTLAFAGRVAAEAGLETAFIAARHTEAALAAVIDGEEGRALDRFGLLRRAWEVLLELPAGGLGPDEGRDLSLLLVGGDTAGLSVAGVGLGACWGRLGGKLRALVAPDHPLLGPPGRPEAIPGVLTVDGALDAVVACPAHLEVPDLSSLPVNLACGVRR